MRDKYGRFIKGYRQLTAKVIKKGQKLALGYKWTKEQVEKWRHQKLGRKVWNKGRKLESIPKKAFKKGNVPWNKGVKVSQTSGNKHWAWKGGTYEKNRKVDMGRQKYREWRKLVLERFFYQCVLCGSTENLNVDHIKPYSLYPKLRYIISNGRVLCENCHRQTDTYGRRVLKFL